MSESDACIFWSCVGGGAIAGGLLLHTIFGDNIIVYFGAIIGARIGCWLGRKAIKQT